MDSEPRIEIVEEPSSKSPKFRYPSERRSRPITGVNTTSERKTYPSIRIVNYTGKASIVVSCVTTTKPYRAHPHALVGKNCDKGICYIPDFTTDGNDPKILCFSDLRIQCCRKKDIAEQLNERAPFNLYPFGRVSEQADNMTMDMRSVRLCFQVTIHSDPQNLGHRRQLKSKVSQTITNKRELRIHDISDVYSPACGGKKIMIFCNKVSRDDIQIRFFEEDADQKQIWFAFARSLHVHSDSGISFTTPKYRLEDIVEPQNVFVEMLRPSDDAQSDRLVFRYVPEYATNIGTVMTRKRRKIDESHVFFDYVQTHVDSNVQAIGHESLHYQQEQQHEPLRAQQQHQILQQPNDMQLNVENLFPFFPSVEQYQSPEGNHSRDPGTFDNIGFSANNSSDQELSTLLANCY